MIRHELIHHSRLLYRLRHLRVSPVILASSSTAESIHSTCREGLSSHPRVLTEDLVLGKDLSLSPRPEYHK